MKVVVSVFCKLFLILLLVIFFTSCATIFTGTKAIIFIDGDIDEPVTFSSSAGEYKDVTLPTLVEVKRRQLNGQHIQIRSEHYSFDDIVLEKTFNGWALVSLLMYGPPFLVDLMTNAVSKPKYDRFFITPLDSLSAADSLRRRSPTVILTMDDETKARQRKQQLPMKFPRNEFNGTLGFGNNQADHFTHRFIDNIIQPNNMEMEGECGNIFADSYIIGKMEYHYRLNRKWDIGAMVAWGMSSQNYIEKNYYIDRQQNNNDLGLISTGGETCSSFSLSPSVRYTWYERGICRFYSRVALGMMRNHLHFDLEKWKSNGLYGTIEGLDHKENFCNKKWRMAYQFSPLGMSLGAGPVRFIFEIGYGSIGVCNIGLACCL